MPRVFIVITGRVQGVGFRWYVLRAATTLGLAGEVRNRADGAVEIEAEGVRERLEELVEAAREGPVTAIVSRADVRWSDGPVRYRDFHVGR
jgi:acylphosphatase